MIHSLRKRHRLIIGILAIILPVLFVLALLARKPIPTNERLPVVNPAKGVAR